MRFLLPGGQFVVGLAQSSLPLALVFTAIAGVVLGMGMPTTPAYIAPTYIVPFTFVYSPSLLLIGPWTDSLAAFASACVGVMCFASALQGYLAGRDAKLWERALLLPRPSCSSSRAWSPTRSASRCLPVSI